MLQNQKLYTIPKIASGKQKFVFFRYFNEATNKWMLFVKKGGANNKNLKPSEQKALLKSLRDALEYKLDAQGWNPITDTYPQKTAEELEIEQLKNMNLKQALEFALFKMKVATKTRACYRCTIKFFSEAAVKLKFHEKYITEIKRVHIKLLIDKCVEMRTWSNKSVNKNLGYLKSMLSTLIEYDVIEYNPAFKIKTLPTVESNRFQPLTEKEREAIREYFFLNNYRFLVFIIIIYDTGIRPKEVLALKIKDYDAVNQLITIIPEEGLENSKTRKIRKVPVNNNLAAFLRELRLEDYCNENFIFGSPYQSGVGNRGNGVLHEDYFKPSATQIKRDTVTKHWRKIVIEKLKINKHLYALKHTGANDKILAGIDLDALRELYGHSSKLMTEKYAKVVKEVYRKQIMDNSPAF